MKIESCFKICRQVNKIYTPYEVLLVDIKLTLCSFLLISALCHSLSNALSFCSWFVATSANHTSICVQDVLHPVPLPYSFVYSPITLCNSRHISCSAIQLFHKYMLSTFHHCQRLLYFLPQGRHIWAKISGGLSGRNWQGLWQETSWAHHRMDYDSIQPRMPVHSKLGLNSFWILVLTMDLMALSTLARMGKKQVHPCQILKVEWLSWVASPHFGKEYNTFLICQSISLSWQQNPLLYGQRSFFPFKN